MNSQSNSVLDITGAQKYEGKPTDVPIAWDVRFTNLCKRIWSLWMAFWFWMFAIISFPFFYVLLNQKKKWANNWAHKINLVWGWCIVTSGCIFVRVAQSEKLPKNEPVVFVANHVSYLDIPVCHVAVSRQFRFIAKSELNRVPLVGWMFSKLLVNVNRESPRDTVRALVQAEQIIKEGISMFIFPEGTTQRAPGEMLGEFKEGAFYLAIRNQVPIVPVAIKGSVQAMASDGKFLVRPAIIEVTILPAIHTKGLQQSDIATLSNTVRNQMLTCLA